MPIVVALTAVAVADYVSPPNGHAALDNVGRDLTALLVGVALGIAAAWLYERGQSG